MVGDMKGRILSTIVSVTLICGCSGLESAGDGLRQITLRAALEEDNPRYPELRSSLSSTNTIIWSQDETISVFDGAANRKFTLCAGEGTTVAEFSGSVQAGASSLYIMSPYNGTASLSGEKICSVTIPSEQTATDGSYDPAGAVMVSRTGDLENATFHHVSSYIKVTPGFDCNGISITSADGSAVAGTFDVTVGADGSAGEISGVSGGSAVASSKGSIKANGTYYIAVMPGTLAQGFSLCLEGTDGKEYIRTKTGAVTFGKGKILNLGTMKKDGTWTEIVQRADSIAISRSGLGMVEGFDYTISSTLYPATANEKVVWISSNDSIASVSNGKITAKRAGTCVIRASVRNCQDSCILNVIPSSERVYRHGYTELGKNDKKAYEYILECLMEFEENKAQYGNYLHRVWLDFSKIGYYPTNVQNLLYRIFVDVPEAFFLYNYIPRYEDGMYYARVTSNFDQDDVADKLSRCQKAADSILSGIKETDGEFERALKAHDSFMNVTHYGDLTGAYAGNIIGGLINNRVVCEGFSRTYLYLCQRAGLKAIYISGSMQTSSQDNTWGNHAWNHVKIGDNWYMCDLTNNGGLVGGSVGHRYFLVGKTKVNQIHSYLYTDGSDPNTGTGRYNSLPELSSDDYPMSR